MKAVKAKNTSPELRARRLLHALGYRYRLHRPDLPGKPDLTFSGRRKVIFIHGCFWHGHDCKHGRRKPVANKDYWEDKIQGNVQRYERQRSDLHRAGWSVLTVWECQMKDAAELQAQLVAFLDHANGSP